MKVTLEGIKAKIKGETYLVLPDGRTTLCILDLENGFTIKGLSACVDPAEFNRDLGRKYAFEDALRQIWPLEGYLLAERMLEDKQIGEIVDLAFDKREGGIITPKKKPHWTQTPEGKKKMAARKSRFTLSAMEVKAIKSIKNRKGPRK
jgi:hypothetical protein